MKKNLFVLSAITMLTLVACGKGGSSTGSFYGEEASSSQNFYSETTASSYTPSFDSIDSAVDYPTADYADRVVYFANHLTDVNTVSYSKRTYVKPASSTSSGTNEKESINYTYHNDSVLEGKATVRKLEGIDNYTVKEDTGYDYDINAYVDGRYLVYGEKLTTKTSARISYLDVAKNSKYKNMYNIYATTKHKTVANDVIDIFFGNYTKWGSGYTIANPVLTEDASTKTLTISATRGDTYGYGALSEYGSITLSKEDDSLVAIKYGFFVFDETKEPSDEGYYTSKADYVVENITYGGRTDFTGHKIEEADVDKVYGSRARKIDYTSYKDGKLSDAQANEILLNLQAYAYGTTESDVTFELPQFIDVHDGYYGVNDDGEYIINGTLSGSVNAKLYSNNFTEIKGTISHEVEDPTSYMNRSDVPMVKQITERDDGVLVIEQFDDLLESHKHTIPAKEVDDIDELTGINLAYIQEAYYPCSIAGTIGINCEGESIKDDEYNSYTSEGSITKSGNTLTGHLADVYCRNVWPDYRHYSVDFKIENGFLSEYSFTLDQYLETDTQKITFATKKYSSVNKRTEVTDFTSEVLDENNYPESTVEEYHESIICL